LIVLYKRKPMMPEGRKAQRTVNHDFLSVNMRFAYKTTIARIAPSWIMISKLFKNSVVGISNTFAARIMCPVEEIGKNSVTPSMIERMIAETIVI